MMRLGALSAHMDKDTGLPAVEVVTLPSGTTYLSIDKISFFGPPAMIRQLADLIVAAADDWSV